ncbi:MAG: DUF721 domain-containing protein [Flavobacteriales bacterium]|nr:DUF721 domain-containing protein [Flavobacteriales bacterium]
MKRDKNDMTLGEAIEYYLRSTKMYSRYQEQEVISNWNSVMGEAIARHTKDIQVRNSVLYVKLDSAVLRKELEMGREKVVRNLNSSVGFQVINTIKFI